MTAGLGLLDPPRPHSKARIALHRRAHWLVVHRLLRTVATVQARRGRPIARLLVERSARIDPYPLHEELRARGRLVSAPAISATTDHALVAGILRDPHFRVAPGSSADAPAWMRWAMQPADPEVASVIEPPSLLAVNPPDHTRYRRLVSRPFTPRALQTVAQRVEDRCTQLLDDLGHRDTVDIVADYAALLPVAVIAEILGVPADMHAQLLDWGHVIAPVLDPALPYRTYIRAERGLGEVSAWFDGHFAALRRDPGDDILSQLVTADPADRLTDRELRATALLLLAAGFETTVNLLGSGIALIAADAQVRARLAADPALWPQAVDELLRVESPVQMTSRVAAVDRTVDGVPIAAGTVVLLLLGAANRDPGVFPDPTRFDLDRPNSRDHVAFSGGLHFCLGASLARMEGATGLRMLFERFPDLRLVDAGVRRDLQTLRGYESLTVRLRG